MGDQVLTENPTTGKVEAEAVQAVRHDPPTWVLALTLADGSTIQVTPEHPFWVDRGASFAGPGWLKAGELRVGDLLRTPSGVDATIIGVRSHVARVEVYTLTLGANHDFWGESRLSSAAVGRRPIRVFVGSARVLVHNCNVFDSAVAAQTTYSEAFSNAGRFAGNSLDSVVADIGAGKLTPKDLPLDYIVRDGNVLVLNTRSAVALIRAGIPRSEWVGVDRTGNSFYERLLNNQLRRNRLTNTGIPFDQLQP